MALLNATKSPFLNRFSVEVRNTIYETVLVSDKLVYPRNVIDTIALLQVCSQIRTEAAPIFYSQNTFHVAVDAAKAGESKDVKWMISINNQLVHRTTNTGIKGVIVCFSTSDIEAWIEETGCKITYGNEAKLEHLLQDKNIYGAWYAADTLYDNGFVAQGMDVCKTCVADFDIHKHLPPRIDRYEVDQVYALCASSLSESFMSLVEEWLHPSWDEDDEFEMGLVEDCVEWLSAP